MFGERRHDLPGQALLFYLLLVFGIAWGAFCVLAFWPEGARVLGPVSAHNPLFILAVYAPALSAIILILISVGPMGLLHWLSRLMLWRMPARWWALILLALPAVNYLAAVILGLIWGAGTCPPFCSRARRRANGASCRSCWDRSLWR